MSRRRVLVVDDDDNIREIACLSLSNVGGWEVVAASSGRQAIDIVERDGGGFAAILLDVMMPELDGPSTLSLIRGADGGRDVLVVFLTAKVQPADRRALSETGAAGILTKPFDPMQLPIDLDHILSASAPRP